MQNFGVHTSCMSVLIMSANLFLDFISFVPTYSYIIKHVNYALLNILQEHRENITFYPESRTRHNMHFICGSVVKMFLKMRFGISLRSIIWLYYNTIKRGCRYIVHTKFVWKNCIILTYLVVLPMLHHLLFWISKHIIIILNCKNIHAFLYLTTFVNIH